MEINATFIFGLLSTIAALMSMQFKDMRLVLICQIICNGTGAVSYLLTPEGGLSGSGIYAIAILQSLVFFILRCKKINEPQYIAYIFAAAYLTCSVFTYQKPLDVVPALAALTCAFGVAQKNASFYRLLILANGIIWLIYDLLLPASITMAVSHIITIASAVLGIVRLDILAKKQNLTEKTNENR